MGLKVLPKKVFMKAAIVAFDLNDQPILQALEIVLMHTHDSNLSLYCDKEIIGFNVNEDIGEIFDEHGDFVDFKTVPDEKIKTFSGSKIIENAHAYTSGSMLLISAQRFSQNNVDYYIPDESGSKTIDVTFSYNDFYLDSSELHDYLERQPKQKTSTNKVKSPVTKRQSKQSLRESEFKTWLATKADIAITDDSSYQQCYKKIGEPTQHDVWKRLQKLNPDLFGAGKDDFFKLQEIIRFKEGTSKGRKPRR